MRINRLNAASGRSKPQAKQGGYVLITVTLSMVVLLGLAGLAADVSYLEHVKRRMQTAADAAALSGAQEILRSSASSPCSDATTHTRVVNAALNDSALNGYAQAANNTSITINCPPSSGYYAGNNSAVEVIVSQSDQPQFFMQVINSNKATVAARAVGHLGSGQGCLIALGNGAAPQDRTGITISGGANLNIGCAVYDNSADPSKAICSNGGGTITASNIAVVGGTSGCNTSGLDPTPTTGLLPLPNPLATLPPPQFTSCGTGSSDAGAHYSGSPAPVKISTAAAVTLNPGVYCGGISISNSSANVTFNPGTYILAGGGLSISTGSASGNGVFFYDTGSGGSTTIPGETAYGSVSISGGTVNFSAPASGTYAGILFDSDSSIQPKLNGSNYTNTIAGNSNSTFNGVFYFPWSEVDYTGTSSGAGSNVAIISWTMKLAGTASFSGDFSALPGGSPIKIAVLGE